MRIAASVCRKSIFDYNMSPRQMYERLIIGGEKTLVFPPPIPPSLALFGCKQDVSPSADGDQRAPPSGHPQAFEKA